MEDIYSDLDNYERVNESENLKELNAELKYKIEAVTDELAQLKQDYDKLHTEYIKLQANYSALLKTAKAEIERKTQMITNLNAEKDQLIFSYLGDSANRYSVLKKRNYKRNWENAPVKNIPANEIPSASANKEAQDANLGPEGENIADTNKKRNVKEIDYKDQDSDTKKVASNIINRRKSVLEEKNSRNKPSIRSEDDADAINYKKVVHENTSDRFSGISSIDSFKPVDEHLFEKQHTEEHRSRSSDDDLTNKIVDHENKPTRFDEKPSRGSFKQVLYEERHKKDRRSRSPDYVFIDNKVEHENITNRFRGKSSHDPFKQLIHEEQHGKDHRTRSLGDGFCVEKDDLENKPSRYIGKASRDKKKRRARSSDEEFIGRKGERENRSKKKHREQHRSRSPRDYRYNRSKYDSRDRHIADKHRSREDLCNTKRGKDTSPTHKRPRNELSKDEYFKRCERERNRVLHSPPQETKLRYRSRDRHHNDRDLNMNDHHYDRDEHYERHEKHSERLERRTSKHKLRDNDEVPATKRTRKDDETRSLKNFDVISLPIEEKNLMRSPNSCQKSEQHSVDLHAVLPVKVVDAEQIIDVKPKQCHSCQDDQANDTQMTLPIRAVDSAKYMDTRPQPNICQSPDEKSIDNPKIIPLERDFTIMTPKEVRLTDPRMSSNKYISTKDSNNKHILYTIISRNIELQIVRYKNDEMENALKSPFDDSDGYTAEVYANIDAPIANMSFESGEITDSEQLAIVAVSNVQSELNRIEISLSGERIEEPFHASEQQDNVISTYSEVEKTVTQANCQIPKMLKTDDKMPSMNVSPPLRVSIQHKYCGTTATFAGKVDSEQSLQQITLPESNDSLIISNECININNDFNKDVVSKDIEIEILENIGIPTNINDMKVTELEEYQQKLYRQIVEDDLELSDDTGDDSAFEKKKVPSKNVSKVKTIKTDKNKDNRSLKKSKVTKSNKKTTKHPKESLNKTDINSLQNNPKDPKFTELFGEDSLMTLDDLSVTNPSQKFNTKTPCASQYQKPDDKISSHSNSLIESSEDFTETDDNIKSTSINKTDSKNDTIEMNLSSKSDSYNKKKKRRKRRITKIQSVNDPEPSNAAQLQLVTKSITTQETAQFEHPDYNQSNVYEYTLKNKECAQFTDVVVQGEAFITSTPMKDMDNFDPKLAIDSNNSSFSQITTPDNCPKIGDDSQMSTITQSGNIDLEVPDVRIFVRRKRATHKKSFGS